MSSKWPSTNGPKLGTALDYVKQIKQLGKVSSLFTYSFDTVNLDNIVFRLHSIITVFILMTGTMFVSMKQYFGDNIECLSSKTDLSKELIQQYCWMEGTFSVYSPGQDHIGEEQAYPGVRHHNPLTDKKVYHRYYQWVYFILIIQSIMFYVPRYLWKAKEARRLRELISELKKTHISELNSTNRMKLTQDVADSLLIGGEYFFFFVFCEVYYFFHLVIQIWFTNVFLSGSFLRLGLEWLRFAQYEEDYARDPLIRVFPRLTRCVFHKYGYSGAIETHDSLCFLPLNIVNEKIYVVLWFWFIFLLLITAPFLVYRVLMILFAGLRFYKLRHLAPNCDKKYLRVLTKQPGNWFILEFIAQNMKPSHFRDLVSKIMEEHYDKNGKPTYVSLLSKQAQEREAASEGNKKTDGKSSKFGSKLSTTTKDDKKSSISKSKKKSFGDSYMPSAPFLSKNSSSGYKDCDDRSDKYNMGSDEWNNDDWNTKGDNEAWP